MEKNCILSYSPPNQESRCISKRQAKLFYTHWSCHVLLAIIPLTIIYVVLTRVLKRPGLALDYSLLPLCIAGVANSIGICLAAEYLICYKIKDVHFYDDVTAVKLAQKVMSNNFIYHTIPLYVAMACIGTLYMSKTDSSTDPVAVFVLTSLWIFGFQTAYLMTPCNGLVGLEKVLDAYTMIDPLTYAILIGLSLSTAAMLAYTLPVRKK